MSKGRLPDWTLCMKDGDEWETVGAGWNTEKGISLVLNESVKGHIMAFHYRPRGHKRGGYHSQRSFGDDYDLQYLDAHPPETVAHRLEREGKPPF